MPRTKSERNVFASFRQIELIAAAGFVVTWSSGFIGARLSTADSSIATVLMWRFLIVAGILGMWWLATGPHRLTARETGMQILIGALAQVVYLAGVFGSIKHGVTPGLSALVAALQPLVAAALAGPILGERTATKQWLGLALGLLGVAWVVEASTRGLGAGPWWAYGLSFLAMAGLVGATILERKLALAMSLGEALSVQCWTSAILFAGLALGTGEARPPTNHGFWLAIAWLVGLSTFGGYGFYWLNLRFGSVTRVSSLIYLTAPTTMLWALVMFGDPLRHSTLVGLGICLIAVRLARGDKPAPQEVARGNGSTPRRGRDVF